MQTTLESVVTESSEVTSETKLQAGDRCVLCLRTGEVTFERGWQCTNLNLSPSDFGLKPDYYNKHDDFRLACVGDTEKQIMPAIKEHRFSWFEARFK